MGQNNKGLRVLSLCGGIETGLLALKQLGIPVAEYHTYEILPEAIAVSKYHFPEVIHHGDLYEANWEDYVGFDLVIMGTCCQSLSRARVEDKDVNNGLKGKSGIVYEAEKALNIIKPKWFMAENVIPSKDEDLKELNRIFGCNGILINSNLFGCQDRERYYWTNIPMESLPEQCETVFGDIMEHGVDKKYFYDKPFQMIDPNKKHCANLLVNTMEMNKRIYNPDFKMATLTCINGGYHEKSVMDNGKPRKLTEIEYERCQGLPDNFTNILFNGRKLSYTKRCSLCGNGWTLPVIKHIFKGIKY